MEPFLKPKTLVQKKKKPARDPPTLRPNDPSGFGGGAASRPACSLSRGCKLGTGLAIPWCMESILDSDRSIHYGTRFAVC